MNPPIYSIVVPLYNTARYLPELLASLERQHGRKHDFDLECIFIDDSSPDTAGDLARSWLTQTGIDGQVIVQQNRGVSAARNNGLTHAKGDWIAFIDSDDFISDAYISCIHRFLNSLGETADDVSLVSCNVVRYYESSHRFDYAHPLRDKFNRGDWVYALEDHPEFIQSQAASAFFPVEKLRASGVRFLEGLHAAEDALFVASYLLTQQSPVIAAVVGSEYYYRQRATGDSAVNQYKLNPDFYFGRFSRGYLPLFETAWNRLDSVPRWLAQYFLYDMRWFLARETRVASKATHFNAADKAEILRLISTILLYVNADWIREYSITGLALEQRNLLLALKDAPLVSDGHVRAYRVDKYRELVQLRYYFVGDLPVERVTVAERSARVVAQKIQRLDYLGQTVVRQRILWVVADDDLAIMLDGEQQKINVSELPRSQFSVSRSRLGLDPYVDPLALPPPSKVGRPLVRRLAGRLRREAVALAPELFRRTYLYQPGLDLREPREIKFVQIYAQRPRPRSKYQNAWLLMDRVSGADDNAEALYWYVREQRADINAFFVVRRGSFAWDRLKKAGARLIDYGSIEHKAALMHASFVISSQLDVEVVSPMPDRFYWDGQAPWRFVYLQHGVLQHDLSIWFNSKPISLITTASIDEQKSIIEDNSSYTLTALESKLTGFPRHDVIVHRKLSGPVGSRRLVLFAPTWRNNMMGGKVGKGPERSLSVDLETSTFGRNWFGLINDARLHEIAARNGLELAFLPHPNFRDKIPSTAISEHVTLITSVSDMTELLLSSRMVVTDYSSIFFDAAVAGAGISYFQFDRDEFLGGGHTYVPGYWSYEENGFGPVGTDINEMVALIAAQLDPERTTEFEMYRERMERTLPLLDGGSSARIIEEILGLG